MSDSLTINDLHLIADEPRVLDTRIAERLGYDRPRVIRELIERNCDELSTYGEVCRTVRQTSPNGGRPTEDRD